MLVSAHASLGKMRWAAHVGKEAMIAAATLPLDVFVDFACVADGMSEPQIARAPRPCVSDALIYLRSDQPDPAQRIWTAVPERAMCCFAMGPRSERRGPAKTRWLARFVCHNLDGPRPSLRSAIE